MVAPSKDRFDAAALVRLTSWGTAAAVSITIAMLATISSGGSQRMGVAIAALTGDGEPRQVTAAQLVAQPADVESERRRLNEAIRLLAADRDRLLTRVVSIERNLDDITGSISRQAAGSQPLPAIPSLQPAPSAAAPEASAAPVPQPPAPPPSSAAPGWISPGPAPWPSPSAAMEIAPLPPTPREPPATRVAAVPPPTAAPAATPDAPATITGTGFGVDIGGGSDLEEVTALWNAAKTQHPRLLAGLRPIYSVRPDRMGNSEMRLIIGPLPNAGAAARLCATLGAADVMCSTRPFEGQRLVVR